MKKSKLGKRKSPIVVQDPMRQLMIAMRDAPKLKLKPKKRSKR